MNNPQHNTLNPSVKFYIDEFRAKGGSNYSLRGWILHLKRNVESLIVKCGTEQFSTSTFHDRTDVYDVYKKNTPLLNKSLGFQLDLKLDTKIKDIKISCGFQDGTEKKVVPIEVIDNPNYGPSKPEGKIGNKIPSIIAVDDFYQDPDEVRDYALTLDFQKNKQYHKGQRTRQKTFFKGTYEFFEDTLKKKITSWDTQPHNGVFQFCTAEDQLVYHTDSQTYAAVVFLTPDAPAECGTSFFKHKANGLRKYPTDADCKKFNKSHEELYWDMFKGNFYDKTPWELVDVVGNVYNRMAIWDAKLVHAATQYFGKEKIDSRLFHMFFFDAE